MALGPFALSLPRLFLLLGLLAAWLTAWVLQRRTGANLEKPLWCSLLVGVIIARLGFVVQHLAEYSLRPWEALYFWQAGYEPLPGAMAALVTAALFVMARRHPPQRLFPPVLVALLVWGGLSHVAGALNSATEKPLPDMQLQDLAGRPQNLADFAGKPLVVNLWATWCPPCRREMPVLQAAQQAEPGTAFVFLNQAESPDTIRRYLAAEQLQLRNVLLDISGQMPRDFHAPGLPTTLFFNAEGLLVATHLGEISRPLLNDYLQKIATE
ncbi:TlpA disulfide reductase family protein [Alkalilimnicola sp. S0819]|uniref:TlpA disulfide reductase family protein n=1 Tax=Alkalilimnicola sp. S0819 TaxID=2613922 RepID=UPI0012615FCC|nr:TlpA disulfide reductase family protein [Alkalilimnicola sp. S0819]KAB7623416.1 TlpA family protein disulfide reductase [Alkalilimnicola sp. S0819]MPQ16962.1 redoxin domain-containing protein [Alkalilimnicola sp. S0819]